MGNWSEWADQLQAELEKQSSSRATTLESLLFSGDYEAIRDWLTEWEAEDSQPESLRRQYQRTLDLKQLDRLLKQRQELDGLALNQPQSDLEIEGVTRS